MDVTGGGNCLLVVETVAFGLSKLGIQHFPPRIEEKLVCSCGTIIPHLMVQFTSGTSSVLLLKIQINILLILSHTVRRTKILQMFQILTYKQNKDCRGT